MVLGPFLTRRSSTSVSTEQCVIDKVKEVRKIVGRKGPPLTAKQEEFCDETCIIRFLKAKGNNVKKAAKQLRATLTWRAMHDIDSLTADEFPAELASGSAFVAGRDEDGRPVLIVRFRPEDICIDAQKRFLLYFAFTMEVSIASMPATANQCVLILDASYLKKSSSPPIGLSVVVQLFRMLSEHYPERLALAFVVDAPPMFHLFWKGISRFLDLKTKGKLRFVSLRNYDGAAPVFSGKPNYTSSSVAEGLLQTTTVRSNLNRAALMNWAASAEVKQQISHIEDTGFGEEDLEEGKIRTNSKNSFGIHSHHSHFRHTRTLNYHPPKTRKSYSAHGSAAMAMAMPDNNWNHGAPSPVHDSAAMVASGANSLLFAKCGEPRSLSFASCRKESEYVNAGNCRSFRRESDSAICRNSNINGGGSSRRWLDRLSLGHNRSISDADTMNFMSGQNPMQEFRSYYHAFLARPYSESSFRSYMKPPLGGLISILSADSCKPHASMAKCKA